MFFSLLFIGFLLPQLVLAGAVLQKNAEPGVSIWLDRELVGITTKEQNGLVIEDLSAGENFLKVILPGYDPAEIFLTVEGDQTFEWRIRLTKSAMKVEDMVNRVESAMVQENSTGMVILKSVLLNAEIFFNGKSIGLTDKKLTYVPAAEYSVRFVFHGKELM